MRSRGALRPRSGLLVLLLLLGGCKTVLMKTPAVVADGKVDPFAHVIPERQNNLAPVFVASGRSVSGRSDPAHFYSTDRSRELRLGLAMVEIGPGMTWEELTRESLAAKRDHNPELVLTSYEEYGPLWSSAWPPDFGYIGDWDMIEADREPAERFVEAVDGMLEKSRRKQITIFVHGFNTKFANNVRISGEFWHYMARDGVIVCFEWPSKGSLFSYQVDKSNANFAIRQFRVLLEFLAASTSAAEINIIAHSAGNPVVVEALRQLSLKYDHLDDEEAQRRSKLGQVVLAAPDMDLDQALSAGIDGAGRISRGVTVYASRKDKALSFAAGIFGDVRLGRSIGKLSPDEQAALIRNDGQWIDATAAQERAPSFLGHSYYHQCPWVSSDVMLFLMLDATAEDRGLVRDEETGFLVFPHDYEDRLPGIVDDLREKYAN